MKCKILAGLTLVMLSQAAHAAKPVMECHTNQRTDAMHCIDIVNVAEDGVVRMANLYEGGPNGIRKTPYFVATNCKTNVTHLKDKDGVSFAGGDGNETPVLRKLREIVCSAVPKKVAKTK